MKKPQSALPQRLHYPDDEKHLPWLAALLDGYAIADAGVAIAIANEIKRRKKRLACGKGCGSCCETQKDVPLYPHELVGIYWYVMEKMATPEREGLKSRLASHAAGLPCPFLIRGSCVIHPLRPLGCRQFNVFGSRCLPDEDPFFTRRGGVLTPLVEYTDRAFAAVISFYDTNEKNAAAAVRDIRAQIFNLQTFDWKKLAANISQKEKAG